MRGPEKPVFSDQEKIKIADAITKNPKAAEAAEIFLGKIPGPNEALEEGKGFTTRPSFSNSGKSNEHPVEFKPGASNIEALDGEDIVEKEGKEEQAA